MDQMGLRAILHTTFGNSTSAGIFDIDEERIIYGQGSDMYTFKLFQSNAEQRFCHPAVADILQECIINSSNYGGVWWNDNEMYNLTNLVSSPHSPSNLDGGLIFTAELPRQPHRRIRRSKLYPEK